MSSFGDKRTGLAPLHGRYVCLMRRVCSVLGNVTISEQLFHKINSVFENIDQQSAEVGLSKAYFVCKSGQLPFRLPTHNVEIYCLLLAIVWYLFGSYSFLLKSLQRVLGICVPSSQRSHRFDALRISRYYYLLYGYRVVGMDQCATHNDKDNIWAFLSARGNTIREIVRAAAKKLSVSEKRMVNQAVSNQSIDDYLPRKKLAFQVYEFVEDTEDDLARMYADAIEVFYTQLDGVMSQGSQVEIYLPFLRLSQLILDKEWAKLSHSKPSPHLTFSLHAFNCRIFIVSVLLRFAFPLAFPCEGICTSCIFCRLKSSCGMNCMKQPSELELAYTKMSVDPLNESDGGLKKSVYKDLHHGILLSVACADSLIFYSSSYVKGSVDPLLYNLSSSATQQSFRNSFVGSSRYVSLLVSNRLTHIKNIFNATIFNNTIPELSSGVQSSTQSKRCKFLRDAKRHPQAINLNVSLAFGLCEYIIRHFKCMQLSSVVQPSRMGTGESLVCNGLHQAGIDRDVFSKGDGILTLVHAMRLKNGGEISPSMSSCLVVMQQREEFQHLQDESCKYKDLLRISPASFACSRFSGPLGCPKCRLEAERVDSATHCKKTIHTQKPLFVFPFDRLRTIDRADLVLSLERYDSYEKETNEEEWSTISVKNDVEVSHFIIP